MQLDFDLAGKSFDRLAAEEWVYFEPLCVEAGTKTSVFASFAGTRTLSVNNSAGEVVASITVEGEPLPVSPQAPEVGIQCAPTGTMEIPETLPGGVYFLDNTWAFLVSRKRESGNFTFVIPLCTNYAFSNWGGRDIYAEMGKDDRRRVYTFSLRRPINREFIDDRVAGFYKWICGGFLPAHKISFIPDYEMSQPDVTKNTRLLFLVGRSEYWPRQGREAFDAYVLGGGDAVLLSSETMYCEVLNGGGYACEWQRWGSRQNPERPKSGQWGDPDKRYPLLPSIGPNPMDGGWYPGAETNKLGYGTYSILDTRSPLAEACRLRRGDRIVMPSVFYDGLPVRGYAKDGVPILKGELPFHKSTLLAHSYGEKTPKRKIGAWLAFQRTRASGRCVHFGSYAWSMDDGLGGTGPAGRRTVEIVESTIRALLGGETIFR